MDDNAKPTISLIHLGGTIVSMATHTTDPFYHQPNLFIVDILKHIPNLDQIACIQPTTLFNVLSHNINQKMLIELAHKISELVANPEIQGIVVTLGTNALEEVAYFLHLTTHTQKPIVFTGAMRPVNALGYDGARNLYNAIVIASSSEAQAKGILLTFQDRIFSAQAAVKVNPPLTGEFAGNEMALLGYVHGKQPYFYRHESSERQNSLLNLDLSNCESLPLVYIFYGHLDADSTLITAMIERGALGIISAGMGNGYQSTPVTAALAEASKRGVIIVRCTLAGQGIVHYDPATDGKYGFIPGGSLTPQKARLLLSIALACDQDKASIKKLFEQ